MEQRLQQISSATSHLPSVEVDSFDGLTVNYAQMRQAGVLLRGLRAVSDFEIELQWPILIKPFQLRSKLFFSPPLMSIAF